MEENVILGAPVNAPAPACRKLTDWENSDFIFCHSGKKNKKSARKKYFHSRKNDRKHCGQSQYSARMRRKDRRNKA